MDQLVLVGAALSASLYHLSLRRWRPKDLQALCLGQACLLLAAVALTAGPKPPLLALWPQPPWHLPARLAAAAGFLLVFLNARFLQTLFPRESSRRIIRLLSMGAKAVAAWAFLAPPPLLQLSIPPLAGLMGSSGVLYSLTVLSKASSQRREGARVLLAAYLLLAVALAGDGLRTWGWLHGPQFWPWASWLLIMAPALIVAKRHSQILARQRTLVLENASLFETVRRQLAELQRSRRLMTIREERMRQETAEYLHGRVQSRLLHAWHQLGVTRDFIETDPQKAKELLESVRSLIDAVRETDIRQVSHALHPAVIQVGLVPAIRSLIAHLDGRLQVVLRVDPGLSRLDQPAKNRIPRFLRLAAYRVLEEALNNSYRHGGATRVEIDLDLVESPEGKALSIRLQDNGRGFDPATLRWGLGLHSLAGRVEQVGGCWNLEGKPGEGACLTAVLPLKTVPDDLSEEAPVPSSIQQETVKP